MLDLCHDLDIALMINKNLILDKVLSIESQSKLGIDFATNILMHGENGALCTVSMDYLSPVFFRRGSLDGVIKSIQYNLIDRTLLISTNELVTKKIFPLKRNDMFIELMRDFISNLNGECVSNELFPRLDKVEPVCKLIATAWENRQFVGKLRMNF